MCRLSIIHREGIKYLKGLAVALEKGNKDIAMKKKQEIILHHFAKKLIDVNSLLFKLLNCKLF